MASWRVSPPRPDRVAGCRRGPAALKPSLIPPQTGETDQLPLRTACARCVIVAPVVGHRHQLGVGPELRHVRVVGDRHLSSAAATTAVESVWCVTTSAPCAINVFAASRSLPGSYQVLIHTTRNCAFGLLARAKHKRIDSLQHSESETQRRSRACPSCSFVRRSFQPDSVPQNAGVVRVDIRTSLVAGRVLEFHVLEFLRHLECRIHKAERRREDELVPCCAKSRITRSASAPSGTFSTKSRDFVTQRLGHLFAASVVLRGPARIANRADVDETDFQWLRRGGRRLDGL